MPIGGLTKIKCLELTGIQDIFQAEISLRKVIIRVLIIPDSASQNNHNNYYNDDDDHNDVYFLFNI